MIHHQSELSLDTLSLLLSSQVVLTLFRRLDCPILFPLLSPFIHILRNLKSLMWGVNTNATIYQNTMDFTIWFFPLLQLFRADTTSNYCAVSGTHKLNKNANHKISFWRQFFIHHLLKRKPFSYVIHILWSH